MVNVELIPEAKKFSIRTSVIKVSPEGILPDAVIVLTLVVELFGNLIRSCLSIGDEHL